MGIHKKLYYYRAKVVSVYDGDTFRADVDLGFFVWQKAMQFRLLGIDTPELRLDEYKAGIVARDRLRELIWDKEVIIETHKAGKYGRWLAEVYLDIEQKSVNQIMLDEGLAKEYQP